MGMNTRYVKEYFYKKKIRSMFVWNLEIIAAILLAAAFSWFFCRSVVVQEGSMEPTLVPGERVLMDSAWYRLSSPKRGDIIAFRTSEDKKASIHIKRVIALPGETVQIKDGQILINGEVYNEKDEYLGHKDWASSNEAKSEDGKWGLYELNFSTTDYEGFAYATVGVGLYLASGTVKASSIKISQNNEMMWTRSFSKDFDLKDPTEVASVAGVDYNNEGVVWEVIRPEQDLTGYKNLCAEEGVEIKIVGGANEGATDDPNVVTGQYSGCLNDGVLGVTEFVPEWFGFNTPCYIPNATLDDQTGILGKILVDLGEEKDFNRIRLHYWGPFDHTGGIGDAKLMRAFYSNDGENWTEFADLIPDNEIGFGWGDSDVRDSVTARYVLVDYLYSSGWGMVSEIEVLSPEAIPDDSSAPAEESKPADESKGGTTEPTSDSGFIALALIASLAVAGAVVIKKSR